MHVSSGAPAPFAALSPRPLCLAAAAACAGALLAREGGPIGCALAVVAAAAAVLMSRRAVPAVVAIPAALGALAVPAPPAPPPPVGPVWVDGVVAGRYVRDTASGILAFRLRAPGGGEAACVLPLRGARTADLPLPGDRVRGRGFARGGSPDRPPPITVELAALSLERGGATARRLAVRIRLLLEDALAAALPAEAARIATHLVLGGGPRLPDDLADAHRATGLSHLLAVSGAHATLLAWLLAAAYHAARGRDPWQARPFRRVCAALLLAYGAITGFEPPVVRALVAWAVVAVAAAHGRRASVAGALALPALVTALLAPADLFSISFCLSYAAVIGLAAAGAFRRPEDLRQRVVQALRASVWAMLATAPLTLHFFGQIAPWTILGTPLLAPLVALMLPLGIATAVLGATAPALAALPAAPLAFLLESYAEIVRALAELPFAPVHAALVPGSLVRGAAALLGLAIVGWRPDRRGLALACVAASVPYFAGPALPRRAPEVVLCDVGHGQAAVATLPSGATVVVDCGTLLDPGRAAVAVERALAPQRRIDVLVLSHGDADHAGGVPRLAARVPIGRAVLPQAMRRSEAARVLAARGVELTFVAPGEELQPLEGLRIRAPDLAEATPNEQSLWARLDAGPASILLPGDAGPRSIRDVLRHAGLASPVDVLVLPHHGRGSASDAARLLDVLAPAVCVASCGAAPDTPLAAVVRRRGTPLLTTAEHGMLRVRLAPLRIDAEHPARFTPRAR